MSEVNFYRRVHATLNWKRIVAFNLLVFLVTVIPLAVRLAREDTENRSSATETPVPSITPPPDYPREAPRIERVVDWFGKQGDTVVLIGKNFGEYQWESKIYLGNVQATPEGILRWSNNIIEVEIPKGARTGKVWIEVNGQEARWEGSLLLTDINRTVQIKLEKVSSDKAQIRVINGAGAIRGIVELSHLADSIGITVLGGEKLEEVQTVDSLGKKTKIEFRLADPLPSTSTVIMEISYPGIGTLGLLRVELYDQRGPIMPVYAEPFSKTIQ